mmetsp:Transcript_9491/g.13898  ORF Transcript_9491/g.13898 Transcript_9491/m.13898 type:complete len:105 (-) Transcript_9491:211-525(-)
MIPRELIEIGCLQLDKSTFRPPLVTMKLAGSFNHHSLYLYWTRRDQRTGIWGSKTEAATHVHIAAGLELGWAISDSMLVPTIATHVQKSHAPLVVFAGLWAWTH